jgi:glycosyltransferase involved in cell wall biosynthesis
MNLVLFLTRGSSLKVWQEAGLLSREMAIFQRLQSMGVELSVVSYGGKSELDFERQFRGIKVICNNWSLPENWYIRLLPYLVKRVAGKRWIGKSNQTLGADIGLSVARSLRQKFIARAGYVFSLNSERSHGLDSGEARYARSLEALVYRDADKVVLTTLSAAEEVKKRYSIPDKKIAIIPNYVDTQLFRENSVQKGGQRQICYVGRLAEAKNPLALIEAVSGLSVILHIVGNGPITGEARKKAEEQKRNVVFWGNVPNDQLPKIINQCELFVLPSRYEGHPKSLLEAMACGLPVVATNVPGSRELIRHGIDGYLCGTSPAEIRDAIVKVLGDENLSRRLGANARKRVVEEFSLDRVADLEMELLLETSRQ